jgi:serine/threonine-protein kinase
MTGEKADIWTWDVVRETMTRLTFDGNSGEPIWTLDGKRIVYVSGGEGGVFSSLCWKAADGTGEVEKLSSSPDGAISPWSWSKDGKTLALAEMTLSPLHVGLGMMSVEGDRARKPLLQEKHFDSEPRISPDGRYMAYESNESGKFEVYVRPFPEVNKGRWQVSTSGGNTPLWSPDGRELFYYSGDAAMAVAVEIEPTFKPGQPRVLFRGKYIGSNTSGLIESTFWDIHPDGKRFLMIKATGSSASTARAAEGPLKINIVVNWFEELKQRVPLK